MESQTYRLREKTYSCQGEGWGKGIVRGFGMAMYTLLYLKWITNKDLLYSTWNSAQCYVAAEWEASVCPLAMVSAQEWIN